MKYLKRSLLLLLVLIIAVFAFNYSKLNIISGYTAKYMASGVFIADRSISSLTDQDTNVPLVKLAEAEVDIQAQEASADVYGLLERSAICREGLGCVLINDDYEPGPYLRPNRNTVETSLPFPYGDHKVDTTTVEGVDYEQLERALDSAFARPDTQQTRTVLVLHKNNILAERYADGFSADTHILGWSMTKSVLATLYGILQYQMQLQVDTPAPVPGWQVDGRSRITYNHLLRMQSSLEWEEDYTKMSDVTRMLFLETDMSQTQAEKEAVGYPTQFWNYSSGTSNLLSGLLRDQFDTYQEYLDFPYSALIDKIGMNSMLIETDLAGNFVGSSYAWASTRDWAKFGLLYLNRGVWNGERIFDEEWINYVSTPTEGSDGDYGAHFWLNAGEKYPDVPTDLYSANGYQGQYVFIIPSKDLVIVRTGLAEPPEFDINSFLQKILDCIP